MKTLANIFTLITIIALIVLILFLLFQYNVPFHNAIISLMGGGAGGTSMNVDFNPLSTPTLTP